MKDVAKHAGVSLVTVSRVVNNSGPVGARTRQQVEATIRELNYVPNRMASNLRSGQSDLLALVQPDITNAFWTSIARGAEDEAWTQGYGVTICNTDNDLAKEAKYIESLIRRRVAGVLMVATPHPASQKQLHRLWQHGVKFVAIHRRPLGLDADVVRTDGYDATATLTTELVRAGCASIAFVGMPLWDTVSKERFDAFCAVLTRAGLTIDPELIHAGEDSREPGGYRITSALLARAPRPDGILFANSRIATGGLRAIADAGLTIPDDVVVAAFHDVSAMDPFAPHLIRAVQPSYQMGRMAARLLLAGQSQDQSPPQDLVLKSEIFLPRRQRLSSPDFGDRVSA